METTIKTNNNDEINVLRIKLDVVEKELQLAITRAEKAEIELEQIKNSHSSCSRSTSSVVADETKSDCCLLCGSILTTQQQKHAPKSPVIPTLPPPPPPPMPNFKLPTINFEPNGNVSLNDGIAAFTLNNARQFDDSISLSNRTESTRQRATGRYLSKFTHKCFYFQKFSLLLLLFELNI